ncbi:shikimate kinase [Hufsiella ginkgonis]|uniref:Shikimate kinase n=1 Tax=Hufsiella ginkgonis TaxID=2695274 RepID=A0A7K1Y1Q0_9SPHI|nr:shikimate kinase [Hufsiella ginkgonis]MXV17132.1 AAA family ATPase [Hufsiella ginkgonis]
MKIFLTGFMGCGKSTLGRKLANKLSYSFVDLDKVIEQNAGMPIPRYFEAFGETAFRELEKNTLQTTAFPEDTVIATGGGLPCFHDNMQWMNEHGISAFISLPPKVLADRLNTAQEERPVLQNLKGEALLEFITKKLAEREPFYRKANYILNGIDLTAEKIIDYLRING